LAVRADEVMHREVNHHLADIPRSRAMGPELLDVQGDKPGYVVINSDGSLEKGSAKDDRVGDKKMNSQKESGSVYNTASFDNKVNEKISSGEASTDAAYKKKTHD
jgi:hypothetical protein